MGIKSWRAVVIVAVAATSVSVPPALAAPDATAVADALTTAAAATGRIEASYANAAASGDTVTITDLKIVRTNAKTITIPSVVVTGPEMREAGGFTADSIAFDGGTAKRGNDVVTWQTGIVEDAVVPSADEIKAETDFRPFAKLVVSGLSIAESNLAKPVTAESIRVVMENDADGYPAAFAAQVTGIAFGAEVLADHPQEKAIVDALGYEAFDVNINAAGSFDREARAMTLETMSINTAEVGTISIKARFTGMSPGKIAAASVDTEVDSDARLNQLEIRFDNAGVVERALDMHAALIWGTRDDAVAQVNAALPLVLSFIGNSDFQTKMAAAVQDFLADPQSITFSMRPAEPVSVEEILKSKRSGLPDLLNADVSAN